MDYKLLRDTEEDDAEDPENEEEDEETGGTPSAGGEPLDQEYWNQQHRRKSNYIHRYIAVFPQNKNKDELEGNRPGGGMRRQSVWQQATNNKRAFFTAVLIGVLVMVLIILASVFVSKSDVEGAERLTALFDHKNESVHLNDILTGKFSYKTYNATWIADDQVSYFTPQGDFMIFNVKDQKHQVLISAQTFMQQLGKRPFQCTLSADKKFVLVAYDSQKIYRHSFYALYNIFDVETKMFHELTPNRPDEQIMNEVHGPQQVDRHLQLAIWSPTQSSIAFVHKNDIYYRSMALAESRRITHNGNYSIYNGVTDWVYEEEMFSSFQAVWFSPTSDYLAFVSFNDSDVDLIQFPLYGDPGQPFQYPMLESIPYPKAGRPNPTVTVNTVNLRDFFVRPLILPGVPIEHYVSTVFWSGDKEVGVVTFNRLQNQSWTHFCDVIASPCQEFFKMSQSNGWLDTSPFFVSKDSNRFLTITSQKQSKLSFKHIEMFNRNSLSRPITKGDFTVDSISGWDEKNKVIYFVGTYFWNNETDPSQTHIYRVGEDGSDMRCLTCQIQNSFNETCSLNTAEFSKDFSYIAHTCSGPNVPETVFRDLQKLEIVKKWTQNDDLRTKLEFVGLPRVLHYNIPVGDGLFAKARLQLPHDIDSTKKYPLLIDVYGGPGSQKITTRFGMDWGTSLVTSKNIIYGSIDGRGSGRQSDDLLFKVYRNLGTVEVQDQINVAKWLIEHTGFIDPNKTAIWGWSYGGFATAMVMGKDTEEVYKCGISVAPVTSWLFYDTIYTERYMGLPTMEDNEKGYRESDVVNHIENFRKKNYYLIHGNADDNVHYQQSMILSRALEKADVLFRQQSYPDENHGLGGVRRHLYHSLEYFLFSQCFN